MGAADALNRWKEKVVVIVLSAFYILLVYMLIVCLKRPVKVNQGHLVGIYILGFALVGGMPVILFRQNIIADTLPNALIAVLYFLTFVVLASYKLTGKHIKVKNESSRF